MSRLRSGITAWARLMEASPQAIYAVDGGRRMVYSNTALNELVGIEGSQLLGRRCQYVVDGEATGPAQIAASLCPVPEAFSGQSLFHEMAILHVSGRVVQRSALHLSLGSDQLDDAGVLTILCDPARDWDASLQLGSEASDLHRRLMHLRQQLIREVTVDELIGSSAAVRRVRDQVQLAVQGQARVVVCGPTGSGREHVAKLIHQRSLPQGVGPVVPLCCPLMDAELLQTTVRAFSRQFMATPQLLRPTLLLIEVDQLPADAQRELAGFFQFPDFELFTVATAERSLHALAKEGKFLVELAEVLSTLVIEIPALSDRKEDIPLLCQFYLERFNRDQERQLAGFSPSAMDELVGYRWPDNVDEVSEVVDESCRAAEGPFVEVEDLAERLRWANEAASHPGRRDQPIVLDDLMSEIEKELIQRAMQRSKGNKTRAAKLLGVSRARLHRRLDDYGL